MENKVTQTAKKAMRNWEVSIIIGAVSIIIGLWCVFAPQSVLKVLSTLFLLTFLVIGIIELWFTISNKSTLANWKSSLYAGIADVAFALVLLFLPKMITVITLIYVIGIYILLRAVWTLFLAFDLKKSGFEEWKNYILTAIICIIFSLIFLLNPNFVAQTIAMIIGIAFLIFGIFRIYFSMKMKGFKNFVEEVKDKTENKED